MPKRNITLMNTEKGVCYFCGYEGQTHKHHCISGTANRRLADEYGLYVYLCPNCHMLAPNAVHRNSETARKLKQDAQRMFEEKRGTREEFRILFGKSYL